MSSDPFYNIGYQSNKKMWKFFGQTFSDKKKKSFFEIHIFVVFFAFADTKKRWWRRKKGFFFVIISSVLSEERKTGLLIRKKTVRLTDWLTWFGEHLPLLTAAAAACNRISVSESRKCFWGIFERTRWRLNIWVKLALKLFLSLEMLLLLSNLRNSLCLQEIPQIV